LLPWAEQDCRPYFFPNKDTNKARGQEKQPPIKDTNEAWSKGKRIKLRKKKKQGRALVDLSISRGLILALLYLFFLNLTQGNKYYIEQMHL
jgi:hypothetical protein